MTTVPSDLVREFEAMGEPVVAHRFTRFDDARMRAAAQEWLAQRAAEREAALDAADSEVERRGRRITAGLAVATAVGWAIALAIIFG